MLLNNTEGALSHNCLYRYFYSYKKISTLSLRLKGINLLTVDFSHEKEGKMFTSAGEKKF